jgi:hypothetical protein
MYRIIAFTHTEKLLASKAYSYENMVKLAIKANEDPAIKSMFIVDEMHKDCLSSSMFSNELQCSDKIKWISQKEFERIHSIIQEGFDALVKALK